MTSDEPLKGSALTAYQAATVGLSPDIQAALYPIFARARLPDDDPLWSLVAIQIRVQSLISSAVSKEAPRDNKRIAALLEDLPRQIRAQVDGVLEQHIAEFIDQHTAPAGGDRWPAWVRKVWEFITSRGFIAVACFLLGIASASLFICHLEHDASERRMEALISALNRLPDPRNVR
ncbi:MAG: hypothetical protein JO232_07105 [Verrucomicrobia bacterium]|jgi:hypothetical protein|nr:hypothetical protein [Verrucomicrobiota bacterium]